jgi:hypothetical protein
MRVRAEIFSTRTQYVGDDEGRDLGNTAHSMGVRVEIFSMQHTISG